MFKLKGTVGISFAIEGELAKNIGQEAGETQRARKLKIIFPQLKTIPAPAPPQP